MLGRPPFVSSSQHSRRHHGVFHCDHLRAGSCCTALRTTRRLWERQDEGRHRASGDSFIGGDPPFSSLSSSVNGDAVLRPADPPERQEVGLRCAERTGHLMASLMAWSAISSKSFLRPQRKYGHSIVGRKSWSHRRDTPRVAAASFIVSGRIVGWRSVLTGTFPRFSASPRLTSACELDTGLALPFCGAPHCLVFRTP